MNKFLLIIIPFLLVGCNALQQKQVGVVTIFKGGKIVGAVDPTTGTPSPIVFAGELFNIVNTVPPGMKMEYSITSYHFWSSKKSVEINCKIDATKVPAEIKITEVK